MPDILQFVDSISGSPGIRLDLNDDVTWGLDYNTDFSPPRLKTAWSDTLLVNGEHLAASAYANRTVALRLDLKTSTVNGQGTELQKLWRELDRPFNFLMWQPAGMTNPVFFRTLRSGDNRVSDYPGTGDFRTVDVRIVAEPFAYGIEEVMSPVTVSNDPAAVSDGCYFDVASPAGDVETPAIFEMPGASDVDSAIGVFAIRRRGTPANTPFAIQAESMTMGTDTSVQSNSATMSGAGSNYVRVSFAGGPGMSQRIYAEPYPAVDVSDARGDYRVLVRVKRSDATSVMSMQCSYGVATGDEVTLPLDTNVQIIDLGLFSIPSGVDPIYDGFSGTEMPVHGGRLTIYADRASGTGTLDIDYVLLVPADDRLTLVSWGGVHLSDTVRVDGVSRQVYGLTSGGAVDLGSAEVAGGWLDLLPGVTNRVFFLRQVSTGLVGSGADDVTATTDITVRYYPRYLHVRPVSS